MRREAEPRGAQPRPAERVSGEAPLASAEAVERIHIATLQVLESTGVAVQHEPALEVFRRAGLRVAGSQVFLSEEQVSRALAAAPSEFVIEGRAHERDLQLGGTGLVLASCSGPPWVLDEEGLARKGTMADFEKAMKLGHMLANVDMNGQCVEPLDLPIGERYKRQLLAALTLSDKAVEYPLALPAHVDQSFDTLEILAGSDWAEKPRMLAVVNTLSPLQFSEEMALAAMRVAERGQVVCVTPSAMGGMTAPVSLTGVLVVQNAEVLAGLVLVQLVREGCPFVYGGTSSLSSMASGHFLVGLPSYWALVEATVALARFYGLPCRAGGALTDSHLPDYQAGFESSLGLAAALRAGAHFVLHATGILSSFNVLSFEKFVLDDQVCGALKTAYRPIPARDEDLAVEVIQRVGPGGNFLLEEHTLLHCHDFDSPTFFNRANRDTWESRGGRSAAVAASDRVAELLEAYRPPELDPLTRRQLEGYCLT